MVVAPFSVFRDAQLCTRFCQRIANRLAIMGHDRVGFHEQDPDFTSGALCLV